MSKQPPAVTSRIPGFYRERIENRLRTMLETGLLSEESIRHLQDITNRLEEEARPGRALGELLAALAHRPVPTGRLHRLWSVSSLSVGLTTSYLTWWLRAGTGWTSSAFTSRRRAGMRGGYGPR